MIKNLMAMLVLVSMAMAPAAVAEMKIVVLDPVRAILESDEGKVLSDAATKEIEPYCTAVRLRGRLEVFPNSRMHVRGKRGRGKKK